VNSDGDCYVPATGRTHSVSSDEFCFKGQKDCPPLPINWLGAGQPLRRIYEKGGSNTNNKDG
jgi:hypothetical protein